MGTFILNHDMHVHTTLSSCCLDDSATPANMITRANELGIGVIGLANHLWDASIPGPSSWYLPQDLQHILRIRQQIPADTGSVRVLVGCESEYCGDGKVGIPPAVAEQLDFVLLPMSHFHMEGFVVDSAEIQTLRDVARLLVKRFLEVIELGIATGIAHPFLALGYTEHDAIIGHISDGAFRDCFGRAAQVGVSIEMQPGFFPSCFGVEREDHHDETFLRMFCIAKEMGCRFHFGSDTHTLAGLGSTARLAPFVRALGLTQEDIAVF